MCNVHLNYGENIWIQDGAICTGTEPKVHTCDDKNDADILLNECCPTYSGPCSRIGDRNVIYLFTYHLYCYCRKEIESFILKYFL